MKIMTCTVAIVCFLMVGVLSVNALTDNGIVRTIDDFVKVKVNGKDSNVICTENQDGSLNCKVNDTGVEYTIYEEGKNYDYKVEVTENDTSSTIEIKNKEEK